MPVAPRGGSWRRWTASVFAGAAVIVAIVWFAMRLWPHSDVSGPVSADSNESATPTPLPPQRRTREHQEEVARKLNQANQLLAQGQPAEAVQVLTEAVQLNPDDEDVRYDLGLAFTRLSKLDEAIQQYREALRIFPNYAEAHNNLGNVLMRTGRTEEAIAQFEASVKIMPDYASAHNNLGTALQKAGRSSEALQHFQKAVKLNPDYWEAHFNVGSSCLHEGKLTEARGEFETVLRLKPDFEPARAALAQVEVQRAGNPP